MEKVWVWRGHEVPKVIYDELVSLTNKNAGTKPLRQQFEPKAEDVGSTKELYPPFSMDPKVEMDWVEYRKDLVKCLLPAVFTAKQGRGSYTVGMFATDVVNIADVVIDELRGRA